MVRPVTLSDAANVSQVLCFLFVLLERHRWKKK